MHFGQWATARERNHIADFKAKMVQELELTAYIESDVRQARRIAEITKRPVACPAANYVFGQN